MERFHVRVHDAEIADLRDRLDRTRWPDEVPGTGWSLGTPAAFLRQIARYWRDEFDWVAFQRRLNAHPQYIAEVEGLNVHFLHVRGCGPDPLPLVLTHGWPSTHAEFLQVIPLLTDPAGHGGDAGDAFSVVVPSIPGFGFSTPYTRTSPRRAHDVWARLMSRLGYDRFGAAGSDIGARITSRLGLAHPERIIGMHLSSVDLEWPSPMPEDLTDEEREYIARCELWEEDEGGYAAIQRTRPQTLAYGLADSPVGLAAWIIEKFYSWSDCGGDLLGRIDIDELLTTVSLYWLTNTINSANRHYWETANDPAPPRVLLGGRLETPTGIAMFPGESELVVPRSFAERCYNVTRWSTMPRGGHFPAIEEPALLTEEIRAFFRPLR